MATTTAPDPVAEARAARGEGPALALVLAVGAWLVLSALLLLRDLAWAGGTGVVLGLGLLWWAALQHRSSARHGWRLIAWTGLALVLAPVVFRYGDQGRSALAYVNSIVCGLLVLGAAAWALRRRARAAGR